MKKSDDNWKILERLDQSSVKSIVIFFCEYFSFLQEQEAVRVHRCQRSEKKHLSGNQSTTTSVC